MDAVFERECLGGKSSRTLGVEDWTVSSTRVFRVDVDGVRNGLLVLKGLGTRTGSVDDGNEIDLGSLAKGRYGSSSAAIVTFDTLDDKLHPL
jgi:hypothetical protein